MSSSLTRGTRYVGGASWTGTGLQTHGNRFDSCRLFQTKGNKMKIAVCSDLHLEFDTITLENTENAQVLILGGDICVARDLLDKDSAEVFDRFPVIKKKYDKY